MLLAGFCQVYHVRVSMAPSSAAGDLLSFQVMTDESESSLPPCFASDFLGSKVPWRGFLYLSLTQEAFTAMNARRSSTLLQALPA
jgi:hypothetical protein